MKIQCDVCERSPATVICCADEAALCAKCDVEVHAANKLASKHQRLLLQCLSNKLPRCDICQEKAAFIFCVQDRALFCQDCDEPIHSAGSLAANHQRFLATGIKVDLSSNCTKSTNKIRSLDPPRQNDPLISVKLALQQQISTPSEGWGMDELLQLSEVNSTHDVKDEIHFGEVDWLSDMGIFGEQIPQEPMAAAEVPQLPMLQTGPYSSPLRSTKLGFSQKNARTESREHYDEEEEEEHFTVPDLG